jgi:chromobox protein 1
MPPALSDEEPQASSSDNEEIPYRGKNQAADEEEDEEGDGEEGEEEYVVEKIISHAFNDDGTVVYEVKWLGYEKKADRTWEPESNLSGATEVLKEYFESIGGRPVAPEKKPKKRGRKKSGVPESQESTPAAPAIPPAKRAKKAWEPPPGSWENDVEEVTTVDEKENLQTGKVERQACLNWKNGHKTQHSLPIIYRKCPQKMLQYYERHLVFTTTKSYPADDDFGEVNGTVKEEADPITE